MISKKANINISSNTTNKSSISSNAKIQNDSDSESENSVSVLLNDNSIANDSEEDNNDESNVKIDLKEGEELLLTTKKRVKTWKPFDEQFLIGNEGLGRIYTEFPNIFKFRGRGYEVTKLFLNDYFGCFHLQHFNM